MRFVFVVLVVVVGALPITKCLLCLVRVAPPVLLLLLFLLCHASFSFPQRGTNVCTHKKETYNVEHVLLRFRFFLGQIFSQEEKKKKKKKISPVKVAKRQSFPFQFSVSLCHCVFSIILTCFTICRVLRSMFVFYIPCISVYLSPFLSQSVSAVSLN